MNDALTITNSLLHRILYTRVFKKNHLDLQFKMMDNTVKSNVDPANLDEFSNTTSPMGNTLRPMDTKERTCMEMGKQQCEDGVCALSNDLCPEKHNISESTMLIMVIVGLTIVIFLIILYCLQQRGRYRTQSLSAESHTDQHSTAEVDNTDNLSLYQPPPPYEEVMSSSIYPNTRMMHQRMNSFSINVPPTPPPNYDAALNILARSQELISTKGDPLPSTHQKQLNIRRCQSEEILTPSLLTNASIFTFNNIQSGDIVTPSPETSVFPFTNITQSNENR